MKVDYRTAVEWDITTWSRALKFWKNAIIHQNYCVQKGLEIGSRNGGVTWFFVKEFGSEICCTDYDHPTEAAYQLHAKSGLSQCITYAKADVTNLSYPDQTFDFVVFKSVLGVVGNNGQVAKIEQAISEMHRVLKPGGILFFAENQKGSWLHQKARKVFVRWGKKWHYLSSDETETLFHRFSTTAIRSTGFFAAFVLKPEWLKGLVARFDPLFFFFPKSWRYVVYGYAIK